MSKLGVTPWDIVRAPAMEAGGFIDANPSVGSSEPIRLLIDENGAGKDAQRMLNTTTQKALISASLPSLFTGGMRKLMQVSHLRGESWFTDAGHHLFLPYWSDTYGVWVSTAIAGFCNRYIIRICASGIYRIPINFSQPLPENWQALETAAQTMSADDAAQAVGRLWSAGKFDPNLAVKIADAPTMYSEHSGFYAGCGWAFNNDGAQAINTAWRIDPADETGRRKVSSMWQINITESGGVPVSATAVMVEEDRLVNLLRDDTTLAGNNAILQVAGDIPGVCNTFVCWPGFSNIGEGAAAAPVFAYFDFNDGLQVVRSHYNPGGSPVNSSSGSLSLTLIGVAAQRFGNTDGLPDTGQARVESLPTYSSQSGVETAVVTFTSPANVQGGAGYSTTHTEAYFAQDGGSTYLISSSFRVTNFGWRQQLGPSSYINRDNYTFGGYGWTTRAPGTRCTHHTISGAESHDVRDVIILHGYDRTSFAHLRKDVTVWSGRSRSQVYAPVAVGNGGPEVDQGSGYQSCEVGTFGSDHVGSIFNPTSGALIPAGTFEFGPPIGTFSEPDQVTSVISASIVIGLEIYDMDTSSDPALDYSFDLYLEGANFNYSASGSWFRPERVAYDTYLNATSVAAGFNYANCVNRLHAFIGVF